MNKLPFVSMFSQSATGISILKNDLIVTIVSKKLIKQSHETFRIKDFLVKDTQQSKHALIPKGKLLGEIILSIPRELTIIREVDYPHSNLKELKDALEYQLDSFIPFSNQDVYFDIYSLSHNKTNSKILIVAVKKSELDNILTKLQDIDLLPARVIISPFAFLPILGERNNSFALINKNSDNYSYNLFEKNQLVFSSIVKTKEDVIKHIKSNLPGEIVSTVAENGFLSNESAVPCQLLNEDSESYGAAHYGLSDYPCNLSLVKSRRKRLNSQLTLTFVFTGFLVFFVFIIFYIQKINNLAILKVVNAQIKSIKKDVSIVEKLQEQIGILNEATGKINNIKGNYVPRIDIILELAKTLPNDAWAKAISITDNQFEIEGDATSSTNLIPILENSSLFSSVGLASPVTKTQSNREKFRIKGNISNKE